MTPTETWWYNEATGFIFATPRDKNGSATGMAMPICRATPQAVARIARVPEMEREIAALKAEIADLKDALAPFALHAQRIKGQYPGDSPLWPVYRAGSSILSWGAFMTAMEALDIK